MKKWFFCNIIFGLLMPLVGVSQSVDTVLFSAPGGFYPSSFSLELFHPQAQNQIRYTTNGNIPTAQSRLYTRPLFLDERCYSTSDIYTIPVAPEGQMYYADSVQHCIVIRAAVFDENGNCVSEVVTNSYFIRSLGCDTHGLPVMSLCSDSLGLFDYHNGIMVPGSHQISTMPDWTGNYFGKGIRWERLCNVEFYELDNTGVNQVAGLRTHGGASRRLQQKGFKILAKEEYGKKRFKHGFFRQIPEDSFKHLSLKPFRCSNWKTTGFQDALAQQAARSIGLDALAFRQMVLFLNGEYWGIYALEEVPDEHYLEDHYEVDMEQCNIIKKWKELDYGDSTHWHDLYQWMLNTDFSVSENYYTAAELIDMDDFIDYQIFEIYSSNVDWPANNVRCWQIGDGKWRWIFYDGDGCFFRDWDVFANATNISQAVNPSNAYSTLFFRRLIQSPIFFNRFCSRFRQWMSTQLNYEHLGPVVRTLSAEIEAEVPSQAERFGFPANFIQWVDDVKFVDNILQSWNDSMENKLTQFALTYHLDEPSLSTPFSCFPNPTKGKVSLSFDAERTERSTIQVIDIWGRVLYDQPILLNAGSNMISLDLPVSPGVYLLKIDRFVTKIIRQ